VVVQPSQFNFQNAHQPRQGLPIALALTGALAAAYTLLTVAQTKPVALLQQALAGGDGLQYVAGALFALAANGFALLAIIGIWVQKRLALYSYGALTVLQIVGIALSSQDALTLVIYSACRVPVLVAGGVYHRRLT
jgi:hypothetical protein